VQRNGALISDLGIWILALSVLVIAVGYVKSGLVVTRDWEGKRG
jgi:hypothetical protein